MVSPLPSALPLPLPVRPDAQPSAISPTEGGAALPASEAARDSFRPVAGTAPQFAGRSSAPLPRPEAKGRTVGSLFKTMVRWPLGMATAAGGAVLGPIALLQFGLGFFFHPLWLTGALTIAPVALAGYATWKLR